MSFKRKKKMNAFPIKLTDSRIKIFLNKKKSVLFLNQKKMP